MTILQAFHPYSIGGGGLVARIDSWLRLPTGAPWAWRRRTAAYLLVGYLPALVVGIVFRLRTGQWDPVISLVDTHVRALVTAPLLLFAEHVIDVRARHAGEYLLTADIIRQDQVDDYTRAIERTERLRNSVTADGLLLLLAVASNALDLSSVLPVHKPIHFWGSFAAVALFRYLLFRWLWRWTLWATFLFRVARMPLSLSSIHPDRVGGLAELSGPSESFSIVAAAGAAAIAAAWFDRMREGASLAGFYGVGATYVVIIVAMSIAPLLVFTGELYRLRNEGRIDYGAFARRYCDAFQRTWFGRSGEAALGAQEIQALAGLGGSYGVLSEMRLVVCDRRLLWTVAVASVIPMLPLALVEVSALELLGRLLKALA